MEAPALTLDRGPEARYVVVGATLRTGHGSKDDIGFTCSDSLERALLDRVSHVLPHGLFRLLDARVHVNPYWPLLASNIHYGRLL